MKNHFECTMASLSNNLCLIDVWNSTKIDFIRKFPKDCKICKNYTKCSYCSLRESDYCKKCVYLEENNGVDKNV